MVEHELDRVLPRAAQEPRRLHSAMRYSTLAPAKRLRPILTILAARGFGVPPRRAVPVAAAFELVHAYSLVHDDLPCMDDDDFRRGRPTCHRRYGEATAVLAGDALLTLAFQALVDGAARIHLDPDRTAVLVRDLARAAGSSGLIAGQVEDLSAEGRRISIARLARIHRRKTGVLFTAALRAGAILGGASPHELARISRFGDLFGRVFQITDDILDEVGDFAMLGKPAGSDRRNEKATYARLLPVPRALAIARDLARRAERTLGLLRGRDVGALQELVVLLPDRVGGCV
jgi:geranylgeranyl diphosphate synthase type II